MKLWTMPNLLPPGSTTRVPSTLFEAISELVSAMGNIPSVSVMAILLAGGLERRSAAKVPLPPTRHADARIMPVQGGIAGE
jgi:hypothetical protein